MDVLSVGKNKTCKMFSKQGGAEQCLEFTLGSFIKTILEVILAWRFLKINIFPTMSLYFHPFPIKIQTLPLNEIYVLESQDLGHL